MSKFYTSTFLDSKPVLTRRAHHGARSVVQSFDGSVSVRLAYEDDGDLCVSINVAEGSTDTPGKILFMGLFSELLDKAKLDGVVRVKAS